MFITIAATCLVCAVCCSFGLELANRRLNWWPSSNWPDHYVVLPHVPAAARRLYFLNNALVSVAFIALAVWASYYEKQIGRLPILTTLCFFNAFINGATSIVLAGWNQPAPERAPRSADPKQTEPGSPSR
jgi:hypothetical protein